MAKRKASGDDVAEMADVVRDLEETRAALARTQRTLAKVRRERADVVDAVYQAARDGIVAAGRVTIPKGKRGARDRVRTREAALLHLTDWQLGKVTSTYNADVCRDRVMRCASKTVSIAGIQRADHPVDVCHVMLGGDLVEGVDIFPGQAFDIEMSAYTQVATAARLVADVVVHLLAEFDEVHVWDVWGNHGRIGRRGQFPRDDNLDRFVSESARLHVADQDRVTWHTPDTWYQIVEVGAYRALLVHGDQIRGFGGNIPAYGILRKATAWSSGVVPEFRDVYLGHYHQAMTLTLPRGGRVFMTPSTESDNEYAREFVAAKGHPGQRLHFVDVTRGRVTAEYLLEVD